MDKPAEDVSRQFPSQLYDTSSHAQKVSGLLAMATGLTAAAMTANWAARKDTSENFLGGLNWGERVFNWHPVLMVAGFMFLSVSAMLQYRVVRLPKAAQKALHAGLHAGAIVCIITALAAVVTSHNYTDHNKNGTYAANLYSNHSLMGLAALVLYFSQYLLGLLFFGLQVSPAWAAWYKPNHIFLGVFTLFAAVFAMQTGLTELTTKLGCSYTVSSADWNPAHNYHRLSAGCQLANGIGIMVFLTALFAAYALIGPGVTASRPTEEEPEGTKSALFEKLHP